jgi:proliferating cell nuclear antigen
MFEARLHSAALLKRVLDAVKDLIVDANLLCTEDGIQLQAMDAAHVSLVCFTLLADAFSLYSCDETVTLGVNTVIFARILKCADNNDSVLLKTSADGSKLLITFESPSGSRTSTFEMNLMDLNTDQFHLPDTEYTTCIKMPSAEFTRMVRDMQAFGDTCTFDIRESRVEFQVHGDAGKATMAVKQDKTHKDEQQWTEIQTDGPLAMEFALKYLSVFTKAQAISDQVALYLLEGVPMYVNYDMGDQGSVGYYLAPKVHEEDA